MWGGRFSKALDEAALRYTTSLPVDRRLYEWDVLGSIAHARMLGRQRIIPSADSAALVDGLLGLLRNPPPLALRQAQDERSPYEDIHSLVEATLAERIGEPAGRLHTARSRNDQIATDIRLFVRSALVEGVGGILELQTALIQAAEQHGQAVMPGYTHLQRAQPVVLGHHLLAYVEMLDRDSSRLRDAFVRADVLPLGAGALAGSPYPLDREYVARLLGFAAVSRNSLDAVSDRDFLAEHLAALAIDRHASVASGGRAGAVVDRRIPIRGARRIVYHRVRASCPRSAIRMSPSSCAARLDGSTARWYHCW